MESKLHTITQRTPVAVSEKGERSLESLFHFVGIAQIQIAVALLFLSGAAPGSGFGWTGYPALTSLDRAFFLQPFRTDAMTNNNQDDVQELIQTLSTAYQNSLQHDRPTATLKTADLILESAAIRLSSRILYEIAEGSCGADQPEAAEPRDQCVLDDRSQALMSLTDMLSDAAHRLQQLSQSAPPERGTNDWPALNVARMRSLEHLYRMVYALSMAYFDRGQSRVYLEAAQDESSLARKYVEIECGLCAPGSTGYTAQLLELDQLDASLKNLQGHDGPR